MRLEPEKRLQKNLGRRLVCDTRRRGMQEQARTANAEKERYGNGNRADSIRARPTRKN
jgi:hypothetical protein